MAAKHLVKGAVADVPGEARVNEVLATAFVTLATFVGVKTANLPGGGGGGGGRVDNCDEGGDSSCRDGDSGSDGGSYERE